MLHPSYVDLMNAVNDDSLKNGEAPLINSRYSIVMAASKRARQLVAGAEPLVDEPDAKALSTAIDEIYSHKIKILNNDSE